MPVNTPLSASQHAGSTKNPQGGGMCPTTKPQLAMPTGTRYQVSDRGSLSGVKPCTSVMETETFLTSGTTNGGDCTSMLSPITKSIGTAEDNSTTTQPPTQFGSSVIVVPASEHHAAMAASATDAPPAAAGAATTSARSADKPTSAALSSVCPPKLPDGVDCCPIPRWNWSQSQSSKRRESTSSGAYSSAHQSQGSKIGASAFGVTEANREAMENLSPFKQWEFTRFLAPQNDAEPGAGQRESCMKPTMVLDLDETLVHTSTELMTDADAIVTVHVPAKQSPCGRSSSYMMYIKYRHSLQKFLQYCLEHYDVIVFTASRNYYASAIVERLEADMPGIRFVGPEMHSAGARHNNTITLLSRDHCTPTNAGYVKDLFLLGCDLRRTVLIDNNIVCGAFQPYNFIHIKDFARRPQADGAKSVESAKHDAEKGMVLAGSSSQLSAPARLAPSSSASSAISTNALVWVDPNDTVLDELIAPGGLLEYIAKCDDIPEGLRRVLADSIAKQTRTEKHAAPQRQ